nr:MAG TPA: hypothetical protein [Caudoviricetes sp.]
MKKKPRAKDRRGSFFCACLMAALVAILSIARKAYSR